jgi:hypothetical protein
LAALVCVSTHAPPQLAKPLLQVIPQTPPLQTAAPLAGASHTVLHPPQCSMSLMLSTQLAPHGT